MTRVRPSPPSRLVLASMVVAFVVAGASLGCHRRSAEARREGDRATAEAEAMAKEVTLTSASVEPSDSTAAFRLEQSDYRGRLQVALDQLDRAVGRSRAATTPGSRETRALRAHRALLKSDLEAVERSTEQDWATLRTKLERDLEPAAR